MDTPRKKLLKFYEMIICMCISWPAIVSPDPWCLGTYISFEKEDGGSLYHVEFLGKIRTHSWLPEEMVS